MHIVYVKFPFICSISNIVSELLRHKRVRHKRIFNLFQFKLLIVRTDIVLNNNIIRTKISGQRSTQ